VAVESEGVQTDRQTCMAAMPPGLSSADIAQKNDGRLSWPTASSISQLSTLSNLPSSGASLESPQPHPQNLADRPSRSAISWSSS
jgi:hypothetical protein